MPGRAQGSNDSTRVYLLLLTGVLEEAQRLVARRYPGHECVVLGKRELREAGWRGQVRTLRKLKGEALVFYAHSRADLQEPQLTLWSGLFHGCRATLVAASDGWAVEYGRLGWLRLLPRTLVSAICDALTFSLSWLFLWLVRAVATPIKTRAAAEYDFDLAYLYPYPLDSALAGGALSHVTGLLSGLASSGAQCEILSGREFSPNSFPVRWIPRKRSLYLFRESLMLSYNLRFVWAARQHLHRRAPAALYQRHGRFVVAGALLSCLLRVPLILEYNASELRMADYGDPLRFRSWLRLCEQVSLLRANWIVVVSDALMQELVERGIPRERILLNPNGVDPEVFRPNCGGRELRVRLGLEPSDVVVGFVGTFSYWHGIEVLGQAIRRLLAMEQPSFHLRFLLIGDGPLCADLRRSLEDSCGQRVRFTGIVPHEKVPAYLDASDILLSPHIPMPDGRPFFGSPTKLFEYMAMSKAIVASNLDQLSRVLSHGRNAWLVEPGNASELASAIVHLAAHPEIRKQLGQNARATALDQHTWKHNAERVLTRTYIPAAQRNVGSGIGATA